MHFKSGPCRGLQGGPRCTPPPPKYECPHERGSLILHLKICWKKNLRFLILSVLLKLYYLFLKIILKFYFLIYSKFTNLQSNLFNTELTERFKVTADIISILIHNNTLQSFVWSSIALSISVSHFENWLFAVFQMWL